VITVADALTRPSMQQVVALHPAGISLAQLAALCTGATEQSGDFTRGGEYQLTDAGLWVSGYRIFWPVSSRTLKLSVWDQLGQRLSSQSITTASGVQVVNIATPVPFAPYQAFYATVYRTDTTGQAYVNTTLLPGWEVNPLGDLTAGYAQNFSPWLICNRAGGYASGDAALASWQAVTVGFGAIDPIITAIPPRAPATGNLVVLGDSQSRAVEVYPGQDWPTQFQAYFAQKQVNVVNGATSGWTTQDVINNMATPLASAGPGSVVVIWVGTNDLYAGVSGDFTASGAWSRMQTIIAAALATGAYVIVVNCLPRSSAGTPGTYSAQQALLNTSIAGSGYHYVDLASLFPTPSDTTFYESTQDHLNGEPGKTLAAETIGLSINGHL
jgi:hypothetical protein